MNKVVHRRFTDLILNCSKHSRPWDNQDSLCHDSLTISTVFNMVSLLK